MTSRAGLLLFAASVALSCAGSAPPSTPAAGAARAPYEAPPAGRHSIEIHVDSRAAVEIFAFLSRPAFDAERVHALGELPAVRLTVQDSRRTLETFERDLAAAFDEETKSVVFDLHSIRAARPRWEALLAAVPSREADLARMAAERAAALLPAGPPVSARLQVYLTFGVAGLAARYVRHACRKASPAMSRATLSIWFSTDSPAESPSARARSTIIASLPSGAVTTR